VPASAVIVPKRPPRAASVAGYPESGGEHTVLGDNGVPPRCNMAKDRCACLIARARFDLVLQHAGDAARMRRPRPVQAARVSALVDGVWPGAFGTTIIEKLRPRWWRAVQLAHIQRPRRTALGHQYGIGAASHPPAHVAIQPAFAAHHLDKHHTVMRFRLSCGVGPIASVAIGPPL